MHFLCFGHQLLSLSWFWYRLWSISLHMLLDHFPCERLKANHRFDCFVGGVLEQPHWCCIVLKVGSS